MENTTGNNNVNNLIEEGKKHLASLQVELGKLANTAEQVAGVKIEEVTKQAEVLINETKTQIETKAKELSESDEFKNLEAEGKKALADMEETLGDLTTQIDAVAKDLGNKFKDFFGGK
jgi:hypothetical protein